MTRDIKFIGKQCYMDVYFRGATDTAKLEGRLHDVMESAKTPTPGRSIFFHETSCSADGQIRLNARQACAIESAARQNPTWDVFVLFASPVGYSNQTQITIIDTLLSYPNIYFRNVDLWNYAKDTPVEAWLQDGEIFQSKFMNSHVSDFLRYLSLFKFGGTYLDLDVIVTKNLGKIRSNYAGAESNEFVAAGIINLEHVGMGKHISEMCLRDFIINFNGNLWGNNGPGVITRVLNEVCSTNNPLLMDRGRCHGFKVFPIKAFYAIPWRKWNYFTQPAYLNEALKLINDSFIVHVWNRFSITETIVVGDKVAYGVLANEFCPKVYSNCGQYF